jgi:ubiquinone/menaquinone biosynthesis C-methylase UbiE
VVCYTGNIKINVRSKTMVSNPIGPLKEHPSTYIVQDRSNQEEMVRLEVQDKMLTLGMGGVLAEQSDPIRFRKVLDVGCGTGGWLMEVAKIYPTAERLVGADISGKMTAYARARAEENHLGGRVEFQTMDALRILEFPSWSFDLVNLRLGMSWLRTWEWRKLLLECQRIMRPNGIIRITEGNASGECNSPALTKLYQVVFEALYRSGRLFKASSDGVTSELVRLLTEQSFQDVEYSVHNIVYRAGTELGQYYYEDMTHLFRVLLPFLRKWTHVPSDYEEIYQQMLKEMQQPDFAATWTLVTAWGTRPDGKPPLMRGLH